MEIAAGNAYNFPLYSHALKSILGFNQQQLTILGVANDIGENVGLLPGIACNKFPPWAVLLLGVVLCFLGYGVLWLAVSQTVPGLPYWVVSDFSTLLFAIYLFVLLLLFCLFLDAVSCLLESPREASLLELLMVS